MLPYLSRCPQLGVSGHSKRSAPERPELVESGPSALWAAHPENDL
jgi:hypothetical protein